MDADYKSIGKPTNEYWELNIKKKDIYPNSVTNKKRNFYLFNWINIPDYVIF